MSGRMSRNKGAAGEREFLRLLGDELGVMLTRNLQQTREGGADCIVLRGWAIEVKRTERKCRPSWWRQACEQAGRLGVQPMVAHRRNREEWAVMLPHGDGWREVSLIVAAGAIREKWVMWP